MNKIQQIEKILNDYTTFSYAYMLLEQEKNQIKHHVTIFDGNSSYEEEVSYEDYMRINWGCKNDDILFDCRERSRMSKMNEYRDLLDKYCGWVKHGRIYVLNKKEMFVSFLFGEVPETNLLDNMSGLGKRLQLCTHYNPLKVDCIEQTVKPTIVHDSKKYKLSTIEKELVEECEKLISNLK